jgi:hypothetical protein
MYNLHGFFVLDIPIKSFWAFKVRKHKYQICFFKPQSSQSLTQRAQEKINLLVLIK